MIRGHVWLIRRHGFIKWWREWSPVALWWDTLGPQFLNQEASLMGPEEKFAREMQDALLNYVPLCRCYYCKAPLASCCEQDRSGPGGCCCTCGGEDHDYR